jgi:hypothetical protein
MHPQSGRTRYECYKRVNVESKDAAKNREYEWIPSQCREKMAVKKLDAASRHSAGDAWKVGEGVKHAVRPRQSER